MGVLNELEVFEAIKVRFQDEICFIQIYRPEDNNTINDQLVDEITKVLDYCEEEIKIIVLEGLPEVFCFGADFNGIKDSIENSSDIQGLDPEPLYNIWLKLASGPYISIAHVRGQTNAGGIGFVAACDIVLCEENATFSLSELLFGLMPACVMPFLVRKMRFSKANYMTLITEPISANCAQNWGLVDECASDSQNLLRKKLLRFRRFSKTGVTRYKRYMNSLNAELITSKPKAIEANMEVFSDRNNLEKIARYVNTGQFPWEES